MRKEAGPPPAFPKSSASRTPDCVSRYVKLVLPLPAIHVSFFSCPAGKMASRKEGTGSAATSSSSTTGAAGKGKGKGGSGDSAVKQVQIDGLVSGVPSPQAHVGSSVPSPVPPDVLSGSLPSGLAEAGPRFFPKTFLYLHFLLGRRGRLLCHLMGEVRAEKGDLG